MSCLTGSDDQRVVILENEMLRILWRPLWLATLCGLLLGTNAPAQQGSVQGLVTSGDTGGLLEGVTVSVERDGESVWSALTNREGFYQIGRIAPGEYQLVTSFIGYGTESDTIHVSPGEQLLRNFVLMPGPVALEGIVVSHRPGATVRDLGRQRVTPADLRRMPVPAGTGDLASYLQTLPGVTTTGDRGGQFFVRGGTPAGNLVLVDGIPIYQPFHIIGFFSVFPEDLVAGVDFYAGGFGARYSGRTSSVLDVRLRDGNPNETRVVASLSPFVAEAVVEGPSRWGINWLASVRRSLIEETSGTLYGEVQPLSFDSQLLKLSVSGDENQRCSALGLRTSDRGTMDPVNQNSYVAWQNLVFGGRCIAQLSNNVLRFVEVNYTGSWVENEAVSLGSSRFRSNVLKMQHDAHVTTMLQGIPVHAGYHGYLEIPEYDLTELFGVQQDTELLMGASGYLEPELRLGDVLEVRPGVVLAASPDPGIEPRLRASVRPSGRASGVLQGAFGIYRQTLVGTSDMRDVGSVFTAWMSGPEGEQMEAMHASVGWQQELPGGIGYSVEGYYKRMRNIPVPTWSAVAQFATRLSLARGETQGVDARIEYTHPSVYAFIGYGYSETVYTATADAFGDWFGSPVQRYHPPHDRRHQLNALLSGEYRGFEANVRWQLGTGLPFTQPLGFDEAFDYSQDLFDPSRNRGTTRLVLDRPFSAALPATHRLDVSLGRDFELSLGTLTGRLGVINAYDRRNIFYYDLFTARRVDQLPMIPYASLTLRTAR